MTDKQEKATPKADEPRSVADVEDEPDAWEERINRTGCAAENAKLTDCWHETKDWRQCSAEMLAFQKCWKQNHNDDRTDMKDADKES
ncbi:uncharacterized protein DNG_10248 [Cephalotrichum gorgonifer]|uniref:CHCH domain-containing protein n=1 Tax=Cephalotrichum gorgonifer TaxID=2041049 RepID=A0AAE8N8U4_9PEZI|nr:uncharacterized protein DNG_10248 [Cephalotrichum gorgonifer]